jgi:hypothetical protein
MRVPRMACLIALGLMGPVGCSSKKDSGPNDPDAGPGDPWLTCVDDAGQQCLCATVADAQTCLQDGSPVAACDCTPLPLSVPADAATPPEAGSAATPFLGTWTLVGNEQYIRAAAASDIIPESATMTFRPGPGPTDAGEIDLLFDAGLGCSLPMSITGAVATLTSAPQTCGASGKPIDRVFTSIEVTASTHFAGWLSLEETFTDQSGCSYLVQGYLIP